MPVFIDIHDWCWTCRGTGDKTQGGANGPIPCPACGGDGKVYKGHLDVSELAKKDEVEAQINALDVKIDALDVKLDAILTAVAP